MLNSLDDWLAVFAFFNRPQLLRLLFVNRFVRTLIEQHFSHRPYGYGILRLVLACDESKRYMGTKEEGEEECKIGIAICDRQLQSLGQENRQATPYSTVRYEWDLDHGSSSPRCVQIFEDGAHEQCTDDWQLLGAIDDAELYFYCDRAFEHRAHFEADEYLKMSRENQQFRVARKLQYNRMLKELYENDFRHAGRDSGLTTAVRIALSDIDIIISHLAPTYVRLFSVDFSLLKYLDEKVWKMGNTTTTDRRKQTAEKIIHLLEHLISIEGIFAVAKVSLPLGPLCHIFGDASSDQASFHHVLQMLSQCAKLRLNELSDNDALIMSSIHVWPNVLLRNWPTTLHKLHLFITSENHDLFGEEFWLNQIAQLLHNTTYDDGLRRCRLKTIKLSFGGWFGNRTKLGQFVRAIIERLYQDFVTFSSAPTPAQQTTDFHITGNILYKCILDVDLIEAMDPNLTLYELLTWQEYKRMLSIFIPKSLQQRTPQYIEHLSPANCHFLNKSGEHWRLQSSPIKRMQHSPIDRWKWQWTMWRYGARTDQQISLDIKLEEQDQCMHRWWAKCEQLSNAEMFGHGNFDPMIVYDERTRIRVISK